MNVEISEFKVAEIFQVGLEEYDLNDFYCLLDSQVEYVSSVFKNTELGTKEEVIEYFDKRLDVFRAKKIIVNSKIIFVENEINLCVFKKSGKNLLVYFSVCDGLVDYFETGFADS